MIPGPDPPAAESLGIKIPDMLRRLRAERHAKRQVEIAVVKPAVPGHTDLIPAHEILNCLTVEAVCEQLHIIVVLVISLESIPETPDGHVGEGEKIPGH
jgi:hypothetical protein